MNKKGFTLIELLGVITILIILFALAFFSYSKYLKEGRTKTFNIAVKNLEDAAIIALSDCSRSKNSFICKKYEVPEPDDDVSDDGISVEDLVSNGTIEKIQSPYDNSICTGFVQLHRNDTGDPSDISYKAYACLKCGSTNSDARVDMAKYIIKNYGFDNEAIAECTELSDNTITSLR